MNFIGNNLVIEVQGHFIFVNDYNKGSYPPIEANPMDNVISMSMPTCYLFLFFAHNI